MQFERSTIINADAASVYSAYEDVSTWSTWDPETESAILNGDFQVGTIGKIKPKGAPVSKIKLIEVTPNESFTVECNLPLCKMLFVHELNTVEQGTEVINKILFQGLLAPIFGRLIGKSIDKSLPESLEGLKQFVELKRSGHC